MTGRKAMVSRRAFVVGGVAAVGALGAASVYAINVDVEDAVGTLLRNSFPGETFDPVQLAEFARATNERHGPFSHGQLLAMDNALVRNATESLTDRDVQTMPTRIITDFIRSSDVLDPDRNGQTGYFAYADPYAVGCSNPLPSYSDAQLEWPDAVYS